MEMRIIVQFLVLTFFVSGVIIFFLQRTLVSSTEGAVKRLNDEIAKAGAKQAELSNKIKQADEELEKRRIEAKELANKMRTDAEEETKAEREKIITKARTEAEDIITKAQGAKEKLRVELEKEFDMKVLRASSDIITSVFSDKVKGALEATLIADFLGQLKSIDMTRVGPDVTTAEVITVNPMADAVKKDFSTLLKDKLGRDIVIKNTVDQAIGGGAILKFGSMALDGSIQNAVREKTTLMQQTVAARLR
jgi:F0F1-type ATP synthase membrane subunit b/b'